VTGSIRPAPWPPPAELVPTLTASDGFRLGAYEQPPKGKPRGGIVVLQEIFGVNEHVRSVADGYAADGYRVIAPAIFDRAEAGVELGYDAPGMERGRNLRAAIKPEHTIADVAAAVAWLNDAGRVAVIGYCWGGSLAWFAATRIPGLACTVGYYGGMVAGALNEKPRCPVMLHFGEEDRSIPASDVAKIRAAADPAVVEVFTYPGAGHAFNRAGNAAWHGPSAAKARERTLAFLRRHVG
jgi:carboxymethylenebutenolidase